VSDVLTPFERGHARSLGDRPTPALQRLVPHREVLPHLRAGVGVDPADALVDALDAVVIRTNSSLARSSPIDSSSP
jgi:hypothetical protein